MFRAVPMLRLSAVVLARDQRSILRSLGRMGAVQLTRTPSADMAPQAHPPDRSRELARCDRMLGRIVELRRSLELSTPSDAAGGVMSLDEAEDALVTMGGQDQRMVGAARGRSTAFKRAPEHSSARATV